MVTCHKLVPLALRARGKGNAIHLTGGEKKKKRSKKKKKKKKKKLGNEETFANLRGVGGKGGR